jgi:hypothetical protein
LKKILIRGPACPAVLPLPPDKLPGPAIDDWGEYRCLATEPGIIFLALMGTPNVSLSAPDEIADVGFTAEKHTNA